MRSLVVVTAGLSSPSSTRALGDALSAATASHVTARGEGVDVTVVELRELAAELAEAMTNWVTVMSFNFTCFRVFSANGKECNFKVKINLRFNNNRALVNTATLHCIFPCSINFIETFYTRLSFT